MLAAEQARCAPGIRAKADLAVERKLVHVWGLRHEAEVDADVSQMHELRPERVHVYEAAGAATVKHGRMS